MELTHLKKFKNGKLPGFVGGLNTNVYGVDTSLSSTDWQQQLGDYFLWLNLNSTQQQNTNGSTINNGRSGLTTGYDIGSFADDYISTTYGQSLPVASKVPSSNIRTVSTLNVAPTQTVTQPIIKNGVSDYAPGMGGSMNGSSLKTDRTVKNWRDGGDVFTTGINFLGLSINAFSDDDTKDTLNADYGQSQGMRGGMLYTRQNYADATKEAAKVRKKNLWNTVGTAGGGAAFGAAVGSIVPGLGTLAGAGIGALLGGIIGGAGSAERARKHRLLVRRYNNWAFHENSDAAADAYTKALQTSNAQEYGVPDKQLLYGRKDGQNPGIDKNTGYTKKDHITYTPYGKVKGPANAKGEAGEVSVDSKTGAWSVIAPNEKEYKGDTKYIDAGPEVGILTNRHIDPKTGVSFAKTVRYGLDNPIATLNRQAMYTNKNNKYKSMPKYVDGDLPVRDYQYEGWLPNVISTGLTSLGGLALYLDASSQSVKKPNTYRRNAHENRALSTLAGLRVNPYPTLQQLPLAQLRSEKMIDSSGGLGVGLRYLLRLAALNTTQRNISDALNAIQMQDNSYFSDYAKTALQTGANNAKLAMAANQYDLDYFSRAHAARQQGKQMGMYNLLSGIQQYYANESKRRLFNRTMNTYDRQLSIDLQKALSDIENMTFNRQNAQTKSAVNPFLYLSYGPQFYAAAMMKNLDLAKGRG